MQTIQNMIVDFMKTKSDETYETILRALLQQDVIWAAFSPITGNYYTNSEHNEFTAYLFTERTYAERFCDDVLHKNIEVTVLENKSANRSLMLADFYRSGITALMIDSGQQYLCISLFELIDEPENRKSQDAGTVMNPDLVAKANYLMQQIACKRADMDTELAALFEIPKARYLLALHVSDDKGVVPVYQRPDGKKFLMAFTDLHELRRYDKNNACTVKIATFANLKTFSVASDGILLNPNGMRLFLDQQMLKAVQGIIDGTLRLPDEKIVMSHKNKIKLTPPTKDADEMTAAVAKYLQKQKEVTAAYLRCMSKDTHIRPSYLFIIDSNGEQNGLYKEIAEIAMPLAKGLDLEFISYAQEFGRNAAHRVPPFYKKRRFRLFG